MSSDSELSAAPLFAAMPAPAYRRQTFAPELPTTYDDGEGVARVGLPDFVCHQPRTFTFFEYKAGKLNRHLSQSSSHAALQAEYGIREQSHSFLSNHFWYNGYRKGKAICLSHAYNHSLLKVLALQALHGWQQYIVVFKANPKPEDAKAYCDAGLIWCTEKTVRRLLASIDLCAHGVYFPFALHTTKYSVLIQPTPDDPTLTPEQLTASRRASYEAVVSSYAAATAAQKAKYTADEAAGLLPF